MDITIHSTMLPHLDPEASLAFYRDVLGFEVRLDVGKGSMRWITVGPPGQPDTNLVLTPPAVDPGITEEERQTITSMMAKGTFGLLVLATEDLDAAFERVQANLDKVQASGAEIVQEPIEQPYGVRDLGLRDPAGNMVKIQERH
jgi:predicted enzyme related to lactoylglutathione lyase